MPNEGDNLLHFQYQGNNGLSVPAKVDYFPHLEAWLDVICDHINAGMKVRTQMQIASDEIFTNICSYAYPEHSSDSTVFVSCSFKPAARELILVFSDHGCDFNPLTHVVDPASRRSRKGGVGLLMVRNFADSLYYERRDGHNILTLKMKICEKGVD